MSRRMFTLLLMLGLVVTSAGLWGAGSAHAQTVTGGEPPTAGVAEGAPPVPETALPVEADQPTAVVLDLDNGTTILLTLPTPVGDSAPPQIVFSISPRTLGNVTDRNGNPVRPGRVVVDLPSGAVVNNAPSFPANLRMLGSVVRIVMYDANGNPIDRPNFNPPVVLCFDPTPEQEAGAGGLANLSLYTFDSLTNQWQALPSSVLGGQVCATVTHLSLFALTAAAATDTPIPAALPTTGANPNLHLELWFGLGLFLLVLGGLVQRGRTR